MGRKVVMDRIDDLVGKFRKAYKEDLKKYDEVRDQLRSLPDKAIEDLKKEYPRDVHINRELVERGKK